MIASALIGAFQRGARFDISTGCTFLIRVIEKSPITASNEIPKNEFRPFFEGIGVFTLIIEDVLSKNKRQLAFISNYTCDVI